MGGSVDAIVQIIYCDIDFKQYHEHRTWTIAYKSVNIFVMLRRETVSTVIVENIMSIESVP